MSNLQSNIIHSTKWLMGLRFVNGLFSFLRKILLARILSPEDIGLMGIALLLMSIVESVTNTGYRNILIQKKNLEDENVDFIWTVQIIRGIFLSILLFMSASYASSFFNEPRAEVVIMATALSVALKGFTNIGIIKYNKEVDFRIDSINQSIGVVSNFFISLVLAILLRNIWALILGNIFSTLFMCVHSFKVSPYKVKWNLNLSMGKGILDASIWYSGIGLSTLLMTQGDDLLLGKLFGASALASYQISYMIANVGVKEYSKIISKLVYPVLCIYQENRKKMIQLYMMKIRIVASVTVPLAVFIYLVDIELINFLLGEEWFDVTKTLKILAISAVIRSIADDSIFAAINKPKIVFHRNFAHVILMLSFMMLLYEKYEETGIAIAVLLAMILSSFVWWYNLSRNFEISLLDVIKNINFSLVVSTIILTLLTMYSMYFEVNLIVQILITAITYIGVSIIYYFFNGGIITDIISLKRSKKIS